MRRLTYYVATTLDGFVAGPDGRFDRFDLFPFEGDLAAALLAEYPETIPAHRRGPLGLDGVPNRRFDTVLMGRATYEHGLAAGVTSPYPHLKQYVFSRTLAPLDPAVEVVGTDPVEFVRDLKGQEGEGIWLCGGAGLAGQLREEIDELVIRCYPVVIGSGIPLFDAPFRPDSFKLTDSRVFSTGAALTTYAKETGTPVLIRPTTGADLDRVTAVTVDEPVGWIPADRYLGDLAEGMYRPEWTWIAEQDGRVVARALWWGRATSEHPVALDCLYVDPSVADRAALGARLIRAGLRAFAEQGAAKAPLYNLTLPNGWRDDPATVAAADWRRDAALAAGLTDVVERLRLEWTPEAGLPASSGRLVFTEGTDEEFLDVFRRIAVGSLDGETRRNLALMGAEATAREEVDFYLDCPGERSWWRIARTPDGRVAGLALPSATPYSRNVGYLGVVPELRGQGYVDDVLAEITRVQVEAGAELITATTDTDNAPMAAAFARAGYRTTQTRLIWSAPEPGPAS
ncbi:dihydrofolate reductase family protein [Streptomyces sp. NPDC086989]|uniref:dihydrofolate reductase family protein n=1 Tax=Streptomyces sp. NPDC086989 TaxID=3365764 RepID=UPI0038255D92